MHEVGRRCSIAGYKSQRCEGWFSSPSVLIDSKACIPTSFVSAHRMSATALPETIKALRVLPDHKGLEVTTISWASQEKVKSLAENEVIVRAVQSALACEHC